MSTINLNEYLETQVFPALWHNLDVTFPEFGFIQKGGYWQATNKQHSRSLPGSPRPSRVYVYRNTPFGFKIQGGEFITWLEYLNNMSKPKGQIFIDIARRLCEKAGVHFPEWESSPQAIRKAESRILEQTIREDFWSYCRDALFTKQGEQALDYVIKRGFTKKQIESVEFGYYPTTQDIKAYLISKGFSEKEIGYSAREVRSGRPAGSCLIYDGRWEGRLIGVWRDRAGRIVNFWARDITGQVKEHEKYLMLRGGNKSSPYGLNLAQGNELIIVEGFIDVRLLFVHGITNVVAIGGRLLTEEQIKTLEKYGFLILILSLDSDEEGQRGTEGSLNLIYTYPAFKAFVTDILQGYKDPAELIQSQGIDPYKQIIKQAQNGVKWQARRIAQRHDLTTDRERHHAYQEALSFSKKLRNPLDIEDFKITIEKLIGTPFVTLSPIEEKSEVERIQPIDPNKLQNLFDQCTIEDFKKAIENLQQREILICQAAPGIGKTFTMLYMMVQLDLPASFICSTHAECNRAVSILKTLVPQETIAMVTSDADISESEQERPSSPSVEGVKFVVTTYAYLPRKGHTLYTYRVIEQILQDRIVFCDEIQELYRCCEIYLPLAARYLLHTEGDGDTFKLTEKCPKKAKTGDCYSCHLFFKRKSPERRTNERRFYDDFPEENRITFNQFPDLGFLNIHDLLVLSDNYIPIHGTLFHMPFKQYSKDTAIEAAGDGFKGYINSLLNTLKGGHIRTEFPLVKGKPSRSELLPEQGQIKYPVMPCNIPILCGLDTLPLIQLMTYSKQLILASATIPPKFLEIVQEVAREKNWEVKAPIEINEVPFRFDVSVLKTDKELSIERQAKLIVAIEKETEEKIFVVTDKKHTARRLVNILRKYIPDKVVLFERQDYESLIEVEKKGQLEGLKKVIVTYGGSAITKAVDFPGICIQIVDCQQFIPKSGLSGIRAGMTDQEIQMVRMQDIEFRLTQVIGRLLRSTKERIPGQTVQDGRRIVILLHGLPKELWRFKLDSRLVNPYREYQGMFVDISDRKVVESIAEAILKVLKGGEPDNRQEQGKDGLIEKAEREGIESITLEKRKLITEQWDQVKLEMRFEELKNQILEMKRKGYRWKVIYKTLNLYRYPLYKEQFKQIYNS